MKRPREVYERRPIGSYVRTGDLWHMRRLEPLLNGALRFAETVLQTPL
jgi:hypothetical protein